MISIRKALSILIIMLTIVSLNQWAILNIGSTYAYYLLYTIVMVLFIVGIRSYFDKSNIANLRYFHWFMIWTGICIIRGLIIAEGYWEWKNLTNGIFLLILPLCIYSFTNEHLLQFILRRWLFWGFPFWVIAFAINDLYSFGFYMAPISLLVIFIPALKLKWKLVLIFISLIIIFYLLGARSNVIKFTMSLLLVVGYYLGLTRFRRITIITQLFFLLLPLILLILGATGVFNVFNISEYLGKEIKIDNTDAHSPDRGQLTGDTRTFLYLEVISSAIKNNYVVLGRTPARGNDSEYFGDEMGLEMHTGKYERHGNEVAVLDIFTWTGFVGLVLYLMIFWKASYLAITNSNNDIVKLIGLLVAFNYCYCFAENFLGFDIMNLTRWMMIAMCYSNTFREMSNEEIGHWIRGIFEKPYLTNDSQQFDSLELK